MRENKGITLIALVVTIIVLLILSGTVISMITGNDGILTQAQETKFKSELSSLKDEYMLFINNKKLEAPTQFKEESVWASKNSLTYNTKTEENGNIEDILPSISKSLLDKIEIVKGKLLIKTQSEREIEWAEEIGVGINPYEITEDGVLVSSNGNLGLIDENGTLEFPETITEIGEAAFSNVEGLKKIIIPGSVKTIGKNAFRRNTTLENVIIEEGVENIGSNAFLGCSNLKEIVLPDTVTTLGEAIFQDCGSLVSAKLSNSMTEISSSMFANCRKLKSITIPESITTIKSAFALCTSLSELYISKNVTSISSNAFSNTTLIPVISPENPIYTMIDNLLCTKDGKTVVQVCKLNTLTELTIPDGIETINLSSAGKLNKLVIPASVTNLTVGFGMANLKEVEISEDNQHYSSDEGAIYNKDKTTLIRCISLEETYTVINGVKTLALNSFQGKNNLKEIILSEDVETIEKLAIYANSNLQRLYIGKNVTTMDGNSIYNTPNLTEVIINSENTLFTSKDGMILTDNGTTLVKMLGNLESITVPSNITKIGVMAFNSISNLKSIILPEGLLEIGTQAFTSCSSLKKIEIPNSVTTIKQNCFHNVNNLEEIIINKPEGSISGAPWGCPVGLRAVKWNG